MRRFAIGFVMAALVAATYVASALGVSSRNSTAVLHFYETPGQRVFIDNAPKGKYPSVGDTFLYTSPVFTRHGSRVGSDHRVCTVIGSLRFLCTEVLQLPNGQLMLQSLRTATDPTTEIAVVGGTGAFVGAHGLMTTHSSGQRTTIDITLA